MNDSKNLILAVVLSALVLLGWTWAANKYFPAANPPSTKVEAGKQQPLPQPQAQPSAPTTAKTLQSVAAALASGPRVSIRTPSLTGSINLKGAQIDDLVLVTQRQTIDKNSPPVRLFSPPARRAPISRSSAGPARAPPRPTSTRSGRADSNVLTPGHPVTLTSKRRTACAMQIKSRSTTAICSPSSRRGSNSSGKPVQRAPYRPRQPRRASQPTRRPGPTMSARSACSTARPITTSTGRTSTRSGSRGVRQARRLARLHRQILADRAGARTAAMTGEFRRSPSGGYQADYAARAGHRRAGPDGDHRTRGCSPAPRKGVARPLRGRRHRQVLQVDRLGLVRLVHAADLLAAEVPVPHRRQFRRRDHLPDA